MVENKIEMKVVSTGVRMNKCIFIVKSNTLKPFGFLRLSASKGAAATFGKKIPHAPQILIFNHIKLISDCIYKMKAFPRPDYKSTFRKLGYVYSHWRQLYAKYK